MTNIAKFLALVLFGPTLVGCGAGEHAEVAESAELAPFMGRLQVFSQKLGFAIRAQNAELARFYLHEIEETVEEIEEEVPDHDGFPIASLAEQTIEPALEALESRLGAGAGAAALEAYRGLMSACNDCHRATGHGFIEVLPAAGEPPFNQRFEVSGQPAPR